MNLRTKISPVAAVPAAHVSAMFELFREYYDHVDLLAFKNDLARKTYLISLFDGDRLVGFSTARVETLPGVKATILYSGDTVLEKAYWGSKILQLAFYKLMWICYLKAPWRPLYWMLMSKGYKTYLLMRRNFPTSYPNHLGETPLGLQLAMRKFYENVYGSSFDPATSLISFSEPRGQLKRGIAEACSGDLGDPDIAFFQERNPGAIHGIELACVAKLTIIDLLRSGLKHVCKWLNLPGSRSIPRRDALRHPHEQGVAESFATQLEAGKPT